MSFLGIFVLECKKVKYVLEEAKFREKMKLLKSMTKNVLFGCFGQQFRKTIVIFEISAFQFALL